MSVGEKRKLTIQPKLGYGSRSMGAAIPANSVLSMFIHPEPVPSHANPQSTVFETELINIKGVAKNEL